MKACLRVLAILSGFAFAWPAAAQEDLWTVNLFFENDLFANTDLNYTNGVRASLISPDLAGFQDIQGESRGWIDRLNDFLEPLHPSPDTDEPVHRNLAMSLGQLIYTPEDRDRVTLDPNDRPYAGWLYTGLGYHARTRHTLHSMEFNLGIIGPAALGEEVQDLIHELRDIETFAGWHNQLENEPGLQVVFERKHRRDPVRVGLMGLQSDVITHWGTSLGNVRTYFNTGAEVRLGWNLPDDFGASTLRPGGDNNVPGSGTLVRDQIWRLHGFLSSDVRVVLRDIFLDGNTFRDSHSVDKRYLVGDLAAGVTLSYGRWRLTYAHVYRTKTFHEQDQAQKYGSLSLSYSFSRALP